MKLSADQIRSVCMGASRVEETENGVRFLRFTKHQEELTKFHSEVLSNLNCVHGALLRMNRSIQVEGTFGGIKWNKGHKRLRRRGIEGVILELGLISCVFNLYKYHLKNMSMQKAA